MKVNTALVLFLVFFLTACSIGISSPQSAPPTPLQPGTLLQATVPVADAPMQTETPTRLAAVQTPAMSSTPAPAITAPPGLVYSDAKGRWLTTTSGQAPLDVTSTNTLLSPGLRKAILSDCRCKNSGLFGDLQTGAVGTSTPNIVEAEWSPDNRYIYYGESDSRDIWVEDTATRTWRNLSNTPDRSESSIKLWPGRPNMLFFYSTPTTIRDIGEGWLGYLTIMQTDGTGYTVISKQDLSSNAAASPDGQMLAFTTYEETGGGPFGSQGWLYEWNGKVQPFPAENLGLGSPKNFSLYSPSWSPDSKQIAWDVFSNSANKQSDGTAIYDWKRGVTQFIRDLHITSAPDWSWDSHWIVLRKNQSIYSLWIADVSSGETYLLTNLSKWYDTCDKAWSPDRKWLAFACNDPALEPGVWLVRLGTWQIGKTDLPGDAHLLGWIDVR